MKIIELEIPKILYDLAVKQRKLISKETLVNYTIEEEITNHMIAVGIIMNDYIRYDEEVNNHMKHCVEKEDGNHGTS